MIETLRLNNIGLQGLATDPAPWSLPPEFITAGRNFRISAGSIVTDGGEVLWAVAPSNFNPAHIIHTPSSGGDFWLIAGRSAVYVYDGDVWTDISSTAGYSALGVDDELLWSSCMLGQIPIINNPNVHPEYWSPQEITQILQPLQFDTSNTWAAKGYNARIFRSHKNFLFALNLIESSVDLPDSYRWSHPADINGLPPTWDETDDSFLAGKASLGGDGGQIIDGLSLKDSFAIYSENAINILDFTNDEFVWKRRELSSTMGLLSKTAVAEVKGTHFFLTNGDVVMNNGNKIESIAHNRIRKSISASIDIDNYDRSYAVRNDSLKEIWFCIPEIGETYPNIAYIYNWKDDSWVVRDLIDNISFCGYGSQSAPVDSWDSLAAGETWDTRRGVWGSVKSTPIDDTVIGSNPVTGTLYLIDPKQTPDNDFNSRIERTNFPLLGERQVTTITRLYPHIKGEGQVSIQVGSHDYPDSPVRWKPPVIFNPSTDRKIDVRSTGELHAWRIDSVGKEIWSMSGMTIEYVKAGLR